MKQIYTTTLRLNLSDEDDRRACEYLQRMDKNKYRSYSKAIVAAVNEYFERQARLADDPYLETREKEDAFLKRITETIENSLRSVQPAVPIKAVNTDTRNFPLHWILRTVSDINFALVWYYSNIKQGLFYYQKYF